jgi:hypothetical protein
MSHNSPRTQSLDIYEYGGGCGRWTRSQEFRGLVTPAGEQGLEASVIKGSSATDKNDINFVYDRTRFCKYKLYHRFRDNYTGRRIAMERRLVVIDFDEHAPCVWAVLEAKGWAEMVEDHRLAIVELVREFYTNIHRRVGDSFLTWVRGTEIHVTLNLISTITRVPQVCNSEYPWSVDHLPTQAEMVACFVEGCPHRMETEGESSF